MRKKAVTKEEIILMAEQLIKDEGLKSCSMRRISKELSIASGTVYNYYNTRNEMLRDVFDKSWNATFNEIGIAFEESDAVIEGLKDMYAILVRDIGNRNGLGGALMAEGEDSLRTSLRKRHLTLIESLLMTRCEPEDISKLSRWLLALIMDSVIHKTPMTPKDWQRIEGLLALD